VFRRLVKGDGISLKIEADKFLEDPLFQFEYLLPIFHEINPPEEDMSKRGAKNI